MNDTQYGSSLGDEIKGLDPIPDNGIDVEVEGMTKNQEILTKAIQKAAGYDPTKPHFAHPLEEYEWSDEDRAWHRGTERIGLFEIIYQHGFAKALWEKAEIPYDDDDDQGPVTLGMYTGGGYEGYDDFIRFNGEAWQYHLQMMVLADDPIAYLGKNI